MRQIRIMLFEGQYHPLGLRSIPALMSKRKGTASRAHFLIRLGWQRMTRPTVQYQSSLKCCHRLPAYLDKTYSFSSTLPLQSNNYRSFSTILLPGFATK
ncbi:uncharacterized protein ARMOST_02246 [Armillaria ostoyae]|uniref:Uncharacterized protein n=1 Tax=Armillaria ostoyae TaxID=47428 RepID=A0A284QR90_ARMOS|nr:uncharacterized protein ARMOST_02246 [Armillaria ostoyae]